jgi:hypothetical protein
MKTPNLYQGVNLRSNLAQTGTRNLKDSLSLGNSFLRVRCRISSFMIPEGPEKRVPQGRLLAPLVAPGREIKKATCS